MLAGLQFLVVSWADRLVRWERSPLAASIKVGSRCLASVPVKPGSPLVCPSSLCPPSIPVRGFTFLHPPSFSYTASLIPPSSLPASHSLYCTYIALASHSLHHTYIALTSHSLHCPLPPSLYCSPASSTPPSPPMRTCWCAHPQASRALGCGVVEGGATWQAADGRLQHTRRVPQAAQLWVASAGLACMRQCHAMPWEGSLLTHRFAGGRLARCVRKLTIAASALFPVWCRRGQD